ncbi:MAG: glycosyltransferase [Alicyclobacillus herbarius]|uniref:glycosyltransferase n=1 Tax=Alicyclobacillus herbarius TaxID=122960 RepID=UPI002352C806|nr:glycosyltransferase [Alicyclobacillus herbarius]MCL6634017.1 glycosyltransferase [Alicyclobacillus herbarius]
MSLVENPIRKVTRYPTNDSLRVVIVHDYLNQRGGAEKVVGVLHEMFPDAPIYTSILDRQQLWPNLKDANIQTSFMQKVSFVRKHFKLFFWLYPLAFRTMRIPECDVVISSSSAYAKGVRLSKQARPIHICYCHTPMRFAWDFDRYIANETSSTVLKILARCIVPVLKKWDKTTAGQVNLFIANSSTVKERIKNVYNRESLIIHPPVELPERLDRETEDFYLVVSRLVSYKRIDLAVQACTQAGLPLVVIGEGPDRQRLQSLAGNSVEFLGFQPDEVINEYLARCKALIFPGEEDFGITPVEAHAQGRPVVAFRAGGALDTILEGVNGLFFDEQSPESLVGALMRVRGLDWDPNLIRETAERFNRRRFEQEIRNVLVQTVLNLKSTGELVFTHTQAPEKVISQ